MPDDSDIGSVILWHGPDGRGGYAVNIRRGDRISQHTRLDEATYRALLARPGRPPLHLVGGRHG